MTIYRERRETGKKADGGVYLKKTPKLGLRMRFILYQTDVRHSTVNQTDQTSAVFPTCSKMIFRRLHDGHDRVASTTRRVAKLANGGFGQEKIYISENYSRGLVGSGAGWPMVQKERGTPDIHKGVCLFLHGLSLL